MHVESFSLLLKQPAFKFRTHQPTSGVRILFANYARQCVKTWFTIFYSGFFFSHPTCFILHFWKEISQHIHASPSRFTRY